MSEPQPHERSNPTAPELLAQRHRQVEALADEYLECLLAGETPDRQAFLSSHPDVADLLEPRLALLELMRRVASAERPAAGETASLAPPQAPGECVLRVKCPHCGNGIQLVEPQLGEVTCGGCGSSFHVDPQATTTHHPAALPRTIGKFVVLEQLGRGAFGTVYKARDPELQRLVAVKVPRTGSFAAPEEAERFLREARAAAQLSHPGIVPVLEVAHDRGLPYIVSEYVEGLTLADVLTARRPGFREAAELIAAVADALDYAHRRQIVHRDVKPSNLLLDSVGRPHVADFGLARRGEGEITVTLDGQILGTPAYMAPEQAAGDQQPVDARSDVYSLGVVLYELLTGELPFRGNQRMLLHQVMHDEPRPPRSLNDRVPRDLETICLKAMAKLPGRRYASASELADDLRRFLNGEPIRARPVGRPERLARWARRNPVVAALTTAVALLLVTATAIAVSFALYQRQANRDLSNAKDTAERNQREAEVRAASSTLDLDLKHCEDGEVEYGVLRLARTLGTLPPHATDLRQCVEMNLLAWAQELPRQSELFTPEVQPLGPTFQHDGSEFSWEYSLSPDGLTVLTGGEDGTARLWDAFTGKERATLRGHRGKIKSVAFSHDGRVVMTVGEDRIVRLWDAGDGQAIGTTAEHRNTIDKALLNRDGSRLLTICHDVSEYWPSGPTELDLNYTAYVTLWDAATGKRIGDLTGHVGHVNDAAFSPDGQTVLTGGADKTARLWSAESGRPLATLQGHTGAVLKVAFSPDGSRAATLASEVQPNGSTTHSEVKVSCVRWWNPRRDRQIGVPCISPTMAAAWQELHFIQHDVAVLDGWNGMGSGPVCYIQGLENGIVLPATAGTSCRADDDCVIDSEGRAYDQRSGKRRAIPPERKFSDDLSGFATDGRFICLDRLVDLRTEKAIGKGGAARYVLTRHTFVVFRNPLPLCYIPVPNAPLNTEVARLFAEVVTCHELDPSGTTTQPLGEATWDQRRRQLGLLLDEHPAPSPISWVASDTWYWLRRQEEEAWAKRAWEETLKCQDRLVAVEPTWQNYDRRAMMYINNFHHYREAALDMLEAGKRAGSGYFWHRGSSGCVEPLIQPATNTPELCQLGLQLAEAFSNAKPEDRDRRLLFARALYRVGRYAEVLPLLESWQRERERATVSHVSQFLMRPWPAPVLATKMIEGEGDTFNALTALAFQAMSQYRLGRLDLARAKLADLRALGNDPSAPHFNGESEDRWGVWKDNERYQKLLSEAETLIEGKPQPEK